MNRSVVESGGSLLVVSNFTLYGDCRKGRRPGFDLAASPEEARSLYEYFVEKLRSRGIPVETGIFQASMSVHLVNDGPVTLICESKGKRKTASKTALRDLQELYSDAVRPFEGFRSGVGSSGD